MMKIKRQFGAPSFSIELSFFWSELCIKKKKKLIWKIGHGHGNFIEYFLGFRVLFFCLFVGLVLSESCSCNLATKAAFHMGPSWASVGLNWGPFGNAAWVYWCIYLTLDTRSREHSACLVIHTLSPQRTIIARNPLDSVLIPWPLPLQLMRSAPHTSPTSVATSVTGTRSVVTGRASVTTAVMSSSVVSTAIEAPSTFTLCRDATFPTF